jgi:hypothetical protein
MGVDDAKRMVEQLDLRLQKATNDRRAMELTFDDITFFGTLTAVAGVAGKSIAARNIGAGVAGLASAIGGHYNPKAQRIAFMAAWAQTRCLRSALNGIDSAIYNSYPLSADGKTKLGKVGGQHGKVVDADLAYSTIPQITYDRVGDIVLQLTNSLNDIQTSGASLSDIRKIAMQVSDAANAASEAPAAATSASKDELDSANAAVKRAKAGSPPTTDLATAQDKLKSAYADLAARTAFLSAVVQYEASANACVKFTSVH